MSFEPTASSPSVLVRLDIPAEHRYLHIVGACLRGLLEQVLCPTPCEEEARAEAEILSYNIELAVHETCTNIVDHAYAGMNSRILIEFSYAESQQQLIVDLHDIGQSFDPETVQEPALDEAQVRGYGLFLIRNLMDEVIYEPLIGGNHWRLVKRLPAIQRSEMEIQESQVCAAVITPVGRIDAFTAPRLREVLDYHTVAGTVRFVLDLSEVDFLDSAGMAVLVTLLKRARGAGGNVKLVWPRKEAARRILRLTRFDHVFDMANSLEEALQGF